MENQKNRTLTEGSPALFAMNKSREERKFDQINDLSQSQIKKRSIKALNRMDYKSQMSNEYNLIMKNQERYKEKIKNIVQRNDKIFNKTQESDVKNLSLAEKERSSLIQTIANQSFINEIK